MHREFRKSKKTFSLVTSLLTLTIAIYIYKIAKMMMGKNNTMIIALEVTIGIFTIAIWIRQIRKCKTSYKYCIISDKLIINKIKNKCEKNVESLKIKDILYIGEGHNMPKEYSKGKCYRHYIRSFDKNKKFYCVYKRNGLIYKFVFEPSNVLMKRIENAK